MLDFIHEEIIDAPSDVVFSLIADLPAYAEWNPFITAESGASALHEIVTGKSFLGPFTVRYRHKIYELTPGKSLCWKDFGLVALAACGDRSRMVEPHDGKTHYQCHLRVTGPFSIFAELIFGKHLKRGIIAECQAMKALAEKRA